MLLLPRLLLFSEKSYSYTPAYSASSSAYSSKAEKGKLKQAQRLRLRLRLDLRPRLSVQAKEHKIPQTASGEPASRAAGMREAIVGFFYFFFIIINMFLHISYYYHDWCHYFHY